MQLRFLRAHARAQVKEIMLETQAHERKTRVEARSLLEQAHRKWQEQDLDQKAKIDELYSRAHAIAASIKERAEAEGRIQETLRARYMQETDDLLAKAGAEMEMVVHKCESVVRRAEDRLKTIKAEVHKLHGRARSMTAEMESLVSEAQAASAAAWSGIHAIKSDLHHQCGDQVALVLETVSETQAMLYEMESEQQARMATWSKGLELDAMAAIRYAAQRKQVRQHYLQWMEAVGMFRNSSLQRLIHLPDLSVRCTHQMQI